MPEVKNCCGCINLRTGTVAFGVLNFIGNIISFVYSIIVLIAINHLKSSDENIDNGILELPASVMTIISAIEILINIISKWLWLFLIYGAVKRNICMLMTWVVLLWIGIIVACIGAILLVLFEETSDTKHKYIGFVICVVYAAISAYQLLVVHSYRMQILRNNYEPLP